MKMKFKNIYQFKITLKGIKPPIWRRIQVPETYTFWDIHVAIQDSMGWSDYHLHQFEILDPSKGKKVLIGIPDEEFNCFTKTLPDWKQKISRYFSVENSKANYEYDFGDGWEHIVKLEKILPKDETISYPVCIAGKRKCPPEDCGSTPGYENILRLMNNPEDEEYESMIEWLGGRFDPEDFNFKDVTFDDPDERLKMAMED